MFGEKTMEYSRKLQKEIPVVKTGKYDESKAKAIEIINGGQYGLTEGDFWILKNESNGKMLYTGMIISHNGCLKINDKFMNKVKPECITVRENGYDGSLVYTYCCPEQGLYEVGEANHENCKIAYPYAMAFKRMFDRVVLKLTKYAYAGIYSEVEADEFRRDEDTQETPKAKTQATTQDATQGVLRSHTGGAPLYICQDCNKVITPYTGNDGQEVTPEAHTAITRKYYGKNLCYDCAVKTKNERKN